MAVALLQDARFLQHDPGFGHPESPDRLRTISLDLSSRPVRGTETLEPPKATVAELERIHGEGYVADILRLAGAEEQGGDDEQEQASERGLRGHGQDQRDTSQRQPGGGGGGGIEAPPAQRRIQKS